MGIKNLNYAEFAISDKVHFWNGKKFIKTTVVNLQLNPMSNVVEYKLFYREGTDSGKRSRNYVTVTALFIQESTHFIEQNL